MFVARARKGQGIRPRRQVDARSARGSRRNTWCSRKRSQEAAQEAGAGVGTAVGADLVYARTLTSTPAHRNKPKDERRGNPVSRGGRRSQDAAACGGHDREQGSEAGIDAAFPGGKNFHDLAASPRRARQGASSNFRGSMGRPRSETTGRADSAVAAVEGRAAAAVTGHPEGSSDGASPTVVKAAAL